MKRQINIAASRYAIVFAFLLLGGISSAYGQTVSYEDFESYAVGSFPSPNWTFSGNANIAIDSSTHAFGSKSLRMFGVIGGCWGALIHRMIPTSSVDTIRFSVRNGSESLSGCHQDRAGVALYTGPSWSNPGRLLINFHGNGVVTGGTGDSLAVYIPGDWYKIAIAYTHKPGSTILLGYWINDNYVRTDTLQRLAYEDDLRYLSPQVGEGTAWFDEIGTTAILTDVNPSDAPKPLTFIVLQNYPNPFNPSTTIRYGLPNRSHVTLTVYNTLGQSVATLMNGEQDAGYHEVRFDGANLPSGMYFYRMQAGSFVETKRLLLVR